MKKNFFIGLFLMTWGTIDAQYDINVLSPQAASLMRYVQHPVNYCLGLADITIPIYEIEIDGQKLPIYLSYHHGGLKTGEFNRQLGQGWTLNAELSIVRSINGKRESVKSFVSADPQSPFQQTDEYLWELASNGDSPYQETYDEDPDDFFYKLLDKSGIFLFKKENGSLQACPIPYHPIVIAPKNGEPDDGFDITDDYGFKYSFEPQADYYYENAKYPDRKRIQTAWKCVMLQNAAGTETVNFTFENAESLRYNLNHYVVIEDLPPGHNDWTPDFGKPIEWLQPTMFRYGRYETIEKYYLGKELTGMDNDQNGVLDDFEYVFKKDETFANSYWPRLPEFMTTVYHTVIRQIKFNGGRMEFIYDNFDHNTIEDLDEIIIYNQANEQIKRFVFHNHYTKEEGNRPQGYYIPSFPMLDSLCIYGSNNNHVEETYRFSYNGDAFMGIPDPWGYITEGPHNILGFDSNLPFTGTDVFYRDERPDLSNNTCMMLPDVYRGSERIGAASQQGLLRSISNSLGGRTEFTYEPNYCKVTSKEYPCATYLGENVLDICSIANPETTQVIPVAGLRIRKIVHTDPESNVKVTRIFKYGKPKQNEEGYCAPLHPEEEEDGLGILSRNMDPTSWSINQKKVYTLLDKYGYAVEEREMRLRTFFSQLYGNTPFNRQPVRYKYVTEYQETEQNGKPTDNGKTVYAYNVPDNPSDDFTAGLYHDATTYYDYKYDYMGIQLSSRTDYRKSNNEYVKQKSSTYIRQTQTVDRIPVGRVFQKIVFDGAAGAHPPKHESAGYCNYSLQDIFMYYSYYIPVGKSLLVEQRDSIFPDTTGKVLCDTYQYDYKNPLHLYLTESRHRDSRNKLYTRKLRYPQDSIVFTENEHEKAVKALQAHNILAPILEEANTTQDVTWGSCRQYRLFGNFPRFHTLHMEQKGKKTTGLQCHAYNANGKPLHTSQKEGTEHTVYLWGYANLYPIAKIEGATHEEITGLLGESFISQLAESDEPGNMEWQSINQLRSRLPSASIYTYTYKPLIGMTSMTDPRGITTYYAYDDFGRLKETYLMEDGVKKTLETYDYHYRN